MTATTQLDYVKDIVLRQIAFFTQLSHFNRKAALAFTLVPAYLAAIATVEIGRAHV